MCAQKLSDQQHVYFDNLLNNLNFKIMNTKMKKISKIISGIVAGLTFMLIFGLNINTSNIEKDNSVSLLSLEVATAYDECPGGVQEAYCQYIYWECWNFYDCTIACYGGCY